MDIGIVRTNTSYAYFGTRFRASWYFYFNLSLVMTFFLFFIGILFGVLKGGWVRIIAASCIVYMITISIANSFAIDPGGIERIVPLMPLMAVLIPSAFPDFRGKALKKVILIASLILILILPYSTQALIGPKKAYVVMPEYRSALELKILTRAATSTDSSAVTLIIIG